jgi:putative ABC transport system permease protein
MIWLRTIQLSIKNLGLHPLRSLLTVLGILIGIASVIWALAITKGMGDEARKQVESLGADTIIVRSIKPPPEKLSTQGITPYGVTREEYDMLVRTIKTIKSAIPIREVRRKFQFESRTLDGRLVGCTQEYADVNKLKVARGHFITEAEGFNRDTSCVLAHRVAEKLFPVQDPIGKRIYMPESTDYFTVVGVLEPKMATAAIGGSLSSQDFSSDIYVPLRTLQQRVGDTIRRQTGSSFEYETLELNQITLRVASVSDVKRTATLIENALSSHDRMEDIAISVPLELLEQARTQQVMYMVLGLFIAAISLGVGGIGIMNIMLATVTERTREIGIRRALGAKRSDIVRQFLIETSVLSIFGGLSGILVGFLCGPTINLVRTFAEWYAPKTIAQLPEVIREVQPQILFESIPIAFYISLMVGILFGIYPAMRAAKMSPIEALRHE